jgi:hypothetical protein
LKHQSVNNLWVSFMLLVFNPHFWLDNTYKTEVLQPTSCVLQKKNVILVDKNQVQTTLPVIQWTSGIHLALFWNCGFRSQSSNHMALSILYPTKIHKKTCFNTCFSHKNDHQMVEYLIFRPTQIVGVILYIPLYIPLHS